MNYTKGSIESQYNYWSNYGKISEGVSCGEIFFSRSVVGISNVLDCWLFCFGG